MNLNGKVQLTMVFTTTPDLEKEGDRLWKSHAAWMSKTHYREGDKALLQYMVSKGTEDDGKIRFVITEVYETMAGLEDHREQGSSWDDIEDLHKWVDQCEGSFNTVTVIDSLW